MTAPAPPKLVISRAERLAALLRFAEPLRPKSPKVLTDGLGAQFNICENVADLHGIELDPVRAPSARGILPGADLRVGDASEMPWADASFRLVIASTVFTSILDRAVRQAVAREVMRVLAPGGALLWYDFAVNNPLNPNVQRFGRRELRTLFSRTSVGRSDR